MSSLVANRAHLQRLAVLVPLCASLAWVLGALLASKDVETLRAGVILSGLVIASLVIFWLAARSDPEGQTLLVLLWVSFGLKLLAVYFRFNTGLLADAYVYNDVGRDYATVLANGGWPELHRVLGTTFVRLITGIFYLITGPTFYGVSIFWTWLGLIGLMLFYKAFVTAFPEGNRRLFLILVLLYPSMLLWTSSLGKDAPMMLFGGMATYGLARLRAGGHLIGLALLGMGAAGMLAIRPHIAAIYVVALVISRITTRKMTPLARIAGLVVLTAGAIGIAVVASRAVGLERLDAEEVEQFISERQVATGRQQGVRGGSAFAAIDTSGPVGLALLIPTVLFRPFPFEAHNTNALLASMEGMGLLAIILYRFRSVRAAILGALRDNFLMFTVLYALMFIFLYQAITNFGIIARQRVQIYPFVLMWIAYLAARRRPREAEEHRGVRVGG